MCDERLGRADKVRYRFVHLAPIIACIIAVLANINDTDLKFSHTRKDTAHAAS